MRRGLEEGGGSNDDGGLADFLGSPAGGSSSVGGSGGARRVGDEADRYGLFPSSTGGAAAGGGSRVAQSRSRYGALFGAEVRAISGAPPRPLIFDLLHKFMCSTDEILDRLAMNA